MYIVHIFIDNEWRTYSFHVNPEHADMNYDVQTKAGKTCRIVFKGQVVRE
jgi:hypothetical protein